MDKITLDRIKTAHPAVRVELGQIYEEICKVLSGRVRVRFTRVFSSYAEQDALYAQGRTKPGLKVTNAKGGRSYHNFGLAIDAVLLFDKNGDGIFEEASWDTIADFDKDGVADWQEMVSIFKQYGWEWGGTWKTFVDKPHFQKTFGIPVVELDRRVRGKILIAGTNYPKLGQL